MHTQVLGLRGNLVEDFHEVWQIVTEKLGTNDNVLAGVVREEGSAEKLGFTLETKS